MNDHSFIPILFKVLFGFVILNMMVNFILYRIRKDGIHKLLSVFWVAVLIVFTVQSIFQTGNLPIALAFGASFLSLTIFSMIGFQILGRKFPLTPYMILYTASVLLTIALHSLGFGFTVLAMPISVATGIPLLHTFVYMNVIDRKKTTIMQKFLGLFYLLMPIHCINFAVFRMQEDAQLWGWIVAYAAYDVLAILLPSIALEMSSLTEGERLHGLVKEKTAELNLSSQENDRLMRVILHDVSSPLMILRFYVTRLITATPDDDAILGKIKKSLESVENIISLTREKYKSRTKRQTVTLKPVSIEDCFDHVDFIFSESLKRKNVSLKFKSTLSPGTMVLADNVSLTHSVLSNLVSNALKFSSPDSTIEVSAREADREVIIEIKDQGPGISQSIISKLLNDEVITSSAGTSGEQGFGYGLSIVKSIVDSYKGKIDIDSISESMNSDQHGTNVRITLERAPGNNLVH